MYKYVIKRLLLMIPVLLGISFAVFFLMNLTPGTPADIIMGELATPEAKEAMKCQETGKSDKKRPNVRKKTAKKEGKQEKTKK